MKTKTICVLLLTAVTSSPTFANDFYVYPTKNQSPDQQKRDEYDCYNWAKNQTHFDPMDTPTATTPPPAPEAPKGGIGKGLLGGAAAGALIGEIADHKLGEGAAIGAIAGGLFGGMRRSNQVHEENQRLSNWEQQQASSYAYKRDNYNRAYTACLEGRGYTVK